MSNTPPSDKCHLFSAPSSNSHEPGHPLLRLGAASTGRSPLGPQHAESEQTVRPTERERETRVSGFGDVVPAHLLQLLICQPGAESGPGWQDVRRDRKSTRLNSSH